ncbi:MAG: hypothetical protein E7455_01095 [Ruminococcaceae bacterium]|nr:hypothetical protein [Oscillospiraceae bacterium]
MYASTFRTVIVMKSNIPYLVLAMCLASGRTIASKKMSSAGQTKEDFFRSQIILFLTAGLLVALMSIGQIQSVSMITVIYGLIYGLLLVASQWMLTLSLKEGNTSLCSTVYALGFIIPTLSGAIIWDERFTVINGIGLAIAIVVVLWSAGKKTDTKGNRSAVPVYIYIAMIASGGLGLMQKIQQSSQFANEKTAFFLIAFAFGSLCSLIAYLCCGKHTSIHGIEAMPIVTGLCFGGSNVCNTILAGRLPSAIFFPVQNISTILLSTLLGMLLFKEKMTRRSIVILVLGIFVIGLFSIS